MGILDSKLSGSTLVEVLIASIILLASFTIAMNVLSANSTYRSAILKIDACIIAGNVIYAKRDSSNALLSQQNIAPLPLGIKIVESEGSHSSDGGLLKVKRRRLFR